jgi:hypothetical protein
MGSDDAEQTDDPQETAPALKAVGDESRMRIVQSLVEHRREHPKNPGLSFSDLREAVGIRDSGRFNYHLDKLRDRFVEEDDGEYKLTYAGRQIAIALVSGEYQSGVSKDPIEHGTCPVEDCTATLFARYEDGYVRLDCADDHQVFQTGFPPVAAVERPMEKLLDVVVHRVYDDLGMLQEGVCPQCYGAAGYEAVYDEEHEGYMFRGSCDRCGTMNTATPGICILTAPAVRSFYRDHGENIDDLYPWELDFVFEQRNQTVVSEDPVRLQIDLTLSGDTISVTVDDTGNVVETERVD